MSKSVFPIKIQHCDGFNRIRCIRDPADLPIGIDFKILETQVHLPVLFAGREFETIEQFDCIRIGLIRYDGGKYYTTIPISDCENRRNTEHPSKAKAEIVHKKNYVEFHVTCDWNQTYVVSIPNTMTKEIEHAIKCAGQQELLK